MSHLIYVKIQKLLYSCLDNLNRYLEIIMNILKAFVSDIIRPHSNQISVTKLSLHLKKSFFRTLCFSKLSVELFIYLHRTHYSSAELLICPTPEHEYSQHHTTNVHRTIPRMFTTPQTDHTHHVLKQLYHAQTYCLFAEYNNRDIVKCLQECITDHSHQSGWINTLMYLCGIMFT